MCGVVKPFVLVPGKSFQFNICLHPFTGKLGVYPVLYSFSDCPEQWPFLRVKLLRIESQVV